LQLRLRRSWCIGIAHQIGFENIEIAMAKKFYTGDGYSAGLGLAGSTQKIVLKIQAYAAQGGQIGVRMCIRQREKRNTRLSASSRRFAMPFSINASTRA
jgi:hypothetical protein